VERRAEVRFEADQPVKIRLLSSPERELAAVLVNHSGRGVCLAAPELIPAGTPVRIDLEDAFALGEVCYCHTAEAGKYLLGVQLEEALTGLGDLRRMLNALLSEDRQSVRSPS
jgi:hypothetical protein